jgi:hypothetical protein
MEEIKNRLIKWLGGYTFQEMMNKAKLIQDCTKETNELITKNHQLKMRIHPHNSLMQFKIFLEANLKEYYKYHQNSDGTRFYPHKWLQTDKETDELYDEWIKDNKLTFDLLSTDEAVYFMTREIHDILRRNGYATDMSKWKQPEKWLTPFDALNVLVFMEEKGDCEDYGVLLHTAIRRMLVLRGEWEENKWRLRSFLGDIINAGYHYSVAWAKEGPNAWINLETTYAPELFDLCWQNNYALEGNWLYQIDYSFDDEKSYKKI